jgi:hypothetical protein
MTRFAGSYYYTFELLTSVIEVSMTLKNVQGKPITTIPNGIQEVYLPIVVVDPSSGLPITDFGGGAPPQSFSKRVDMVGDSTIYIGEALAGSAPNTLSWRVKRVTMMPDGDSIIEWANGDGKFDKSWDNHLSLNYF